MKKIITEELGYMKYLLGYTRGVVISEQTNIGPESLPWNMPAPETTYPSDVAAAAPDAAAAVPESENKANWEDVVKYYEGNKDANWKFDKKGKKEYDGVMFEFVRATSKDTNDSDSFINIYDDGDIFIGFL